jgi:hypothetical protein
MTVQISDYHHHQFIRRTLFIGSAALLICAPAIVRAASLMPIRGVIVPTNRNCMGFIDRLRLHLMDVSLLRGWDARRHGFAFGGISETAARNTVAYARTQGWLK